MIGRANYFIESCAARISKGAAGTGAAAPDIIEIYALTFPATASNSIRRSLDTLRIGKQHCLLDLFRLQFIVFDARSQGLVARRHTAS